MLLKVRHLGIVGVLVEINHTCENHNQRQQEIKAEILPSGDRRADARESRHCQHREKLWF